MRWPVAAHIGLSMIVMASAPTRVALGLGQIHLGDLLVERAAGEHHAERALLELAALFLEPLRAAVLALVVAPDAVVGVVERAGEVHARIGERKAVTGAAMRRRQLEHRHPVDHLGLDRHQMVRIDLVRHLEQDAALVQPLAFRRVRRPGSVAGGELERLGVLGLGLHPGLDLLGEAQLGERPRRGGARARAATPAPSNAAACSGGYFLAARRCTNSRLTP